LDAICHFKWLILYMKYFELVCFIKQTKQHREGHITAVHTKEKHFPCKICSSNFSTENAVIGKL
jgi:hypothetical protein